MINSSEFKLHRKNLAEKIGRGYVILAGNQEVQAASDMAFAFRQESNFWWMCGIDEKNWKLVYDAGRDYLILVMPEFDEITRVFEGSLSKDEAVKISAADDVILDSEFDTVLDKIQQENAKVYALTYEDSRRFYDDNFENPARKNLMNKLNGRFSEIHDVSKLLSQTRSIKTDKEIELIQKSVDKTIDAFELIHKKIKSKEYKFEYQIEADLWQEFRGAGFNGQAYDPIVASGLNACTLHYSKNNQILKKGDMVLIDAATKLEYYPADITRTYAFGDVSRRQKDIHSAVQEITKSILRALDEGLRDVGEYVEFSNNIIKKYLVELGLMSGFDDEANFYKYFPHAISHGLGVDVHDSLGGPKEFCERMIITVEPGIYVPDENIAVRIEENILFTGDGIKNLSSGLSTDY